MKCDLWQHLKSSDKPIVLYGMGNGADKIIDILNLYGIKFDGVFASDGFVRSKLFHGLKIESYAELKKRLGDMIVLVCFGSNRDEVIENINKISSEQELYAPDVPVYGGGLFDSEYAKKNKERIEKIYSLLADDISRRTFECTVKYKLSGNIKCLFDCEVDKIEPYGGFLKLSCNEAYLDLGAYNGDTIQEFCRITNNSFSKIYAVEPDGRSFSKLIKNTQSIKNLECLNACISSQQGSISFAMRGGRNSSIDIGGRTIPSLTVDGISEARGKITLIKADVEGEELNMLKGAANTVKDFKPKMQVACYHRTGDLLDIPEAVLEMRNDYKIYMRHFRYIPCWDTNYYFI